MARTHYVPDEGIYFIEENSRGTKHNVQAGGTGCIQMSQRGILHEWVKTNNKRTPVFNSKWWYQLYFWFKEGVFGKELEDFQVNQLSVKNLFDAEERALRGFKWRIKGDFLKESERQAKWCQTNPTYQRFDKRRKALFAAILKHPKFITFAQLQSKVERACNRIKPAEVEKVKVTAPFGTLWGKTDKEDNAKQSMEAWVYVTVTYKDGTSKNGIITWQNCD